MKCIEKMSIEIWKGATTGSLYYPVDRMYLQNFIHGLSKIDNVDFIIFNLNNFPALYSTQLLYCLPELWLNFDDTDLHSVLEGLTDNQSMFSFIILTYKLISVDIFGFIKSKQLYNDDLFIMLKNQSQNLLINEDEQGDFEEIGVPVEDWIYIRQLLLIIQYVIPASNNMETINERIIMLKQAL